MNHGAIQDLTHLRRLLWRADSSVRSLHFFHKGQPIFHQSSLLNFIIIFCTASSTLLISIASRMLSVFSTKNRFSQYLSYPAELALFQAQLVRFLPSSKLMNCQRDAGPTTRRSISSSCGASIQILPERTTATRQFRHRPEPNQLPTPTADVHSTRKHTVPVCTQVGASKREPPPIYSSSTTSVRQPLRLLR